MGGCGSLPREGVDAEVIFSVTSLSMFRPNGIIKMSIAHCLACRNNMLFLSLFCALLLLLLLPPPCLSFLSKGEEEEEEEQGEKDSSSVSRRIHVGGWRSVVKYALATQGQSSNKMSEYALFGRSSFFFLVLFHFSSLHDHTAFNGLHHEVQACTHAI